MIQVPHLPLLRAGRPYQSLKATTLRDIRDGSPVAEVSQARAGLISRDMLAAEERRRVLDGLGVRELLDMCREAARHFAESALPLGDSEQDPETYVRQLAATTGMPEAMGRANMAKIVLNLEKMDAMLDGLTRGLDLEVLDRGWGLQDGRHLSYLRQADSLGAVLPNNSPGVHALWLPAIPLKTPLVLKPGSAEPWTPYRIAQAFLAAGCPPEAFCLYPSDHAGAAEVLLRTDRSLFFGDANTVRGWQGTGKVQVHGPGWSKILMFDDVADDWAEHLDMMASSIVANGGRSCINASGVWTVRHGDAIAESLARTLAAVEPRALDDPNAALAAFPDPAVARAISNMIDERLDTPGAEDVTRTVRDDPERVVEVGGATFLRPTVIRCTDPDHPLAHSEFGFPFAAVVEVPQETLLTAIGPTLVATALTGEDEVRYEILTAPHVDRLNLGPVPTYQISWDQPHEGNLFDHLYQQRAFQIARAS